MLAFLLKMEWIILLKPNFKPKMDYEQFFSKQTAPECEREKFTIGLFTVLIAVSVLIDCVCMCRSSRKMKTLRHENETLKTIILKSVERSLLKMMHQPQEDDHED